MSAALPGAGRRVLVTGATGFVGRQALGPLVDRGFEVHAVARAGAPAGGSPDGVVWHRGDLLEDVSVVAEVAPTDLLHLAWYAEPGAFWRSEENLRWVAASLDLLRAFADAGGRRAVLAGTCAEYAWKPETHCVEGVTPLAPATLYGAAKHGLRVVAAAFAAEREVSLAWGRIFFLYGPGEDPRRLVSSVAQALVEGRPAPTSHGEQVRDFLDVRELGDAFAALQASSVAGPVNVASGDPVRIREVITAVAEAAGRPDMLQLGARPANPSEPDVLTASVGRLRDEVGWAPRRSLDEAIGETVDWWREQAG